MQDMIEFTYGDINGETLIRTGINGFLNAVTGEVFFCARCQHLTAIKNGSIKKQETCLAVRSHKNSSATLILPATL